MPRDRRRCTTIDRVRAPQQTRSIASTARMLDAAEEFLDRAGPDALTVEAVVRESQASIGSFYARFGDRLGLLFALQERFHQRLDEWQGADHVGCDRRGQPQ